MEKRDIKIDIPKTITECAGKKLIFGEKTYIMGILNVTPDSFSDGGDFVDLDRAVAHAKDMISDGADIIDIGGESTRPGFTAVSAEDEIKRVVPVIKRLVEETDVIISLDTTKAEVAEEGIKAGAHIINDIWGLQFDPDMIRVAVKYDVPVIIMHNHEGTVYQGDLIDSINKFLMASIDMAVKGGL
ncbi:MAG: dihydropteroate synthase, partial [Eubacteriaceae bacterium]|nr:dihydropteroate synthase [Eubacteriaceae bacterium]